MIDNFYFSKYFKEVCWQYDDQQIYLQEDKIIVAVYSETEHLIAILSESDQENQTIKFYDEPGVLLLQLNSNTELSFTNITKNMEGEFIMIGHAPASNPIETSYRFDNQQKIIAPLSAQL